MTYEQVKADFLTYISNNGGTSANWYVGITNDSVRRLFIEHGVDKSSDLWIYSSGDNADIARRIEHYFLQLGLDGGPGGVDETAVFVYSYRKSRTTKP